MSRYPYEPPARINDVVGRKSHFIIERWGNGWAITVKRLGKSPETIMCKSPGEVNQYRMKLSADGLIGINGEARR